MLNRAPVLAHQVLVDLERRIYGGTIAPGEKVNESHLAKDLAVSRGPIREACRLLESERILETFPQRGSFVRAVSVEEANDLFDIRQQWSVMIGALVSRSDVQRLANRLEKAASDMDQSIAESRSDDFFPANLRFHEELLDATGNARLKELFIGLFKELRLFRIRSLLIDQEDPRRIKAYNIASNAGHHSIIDAVKSGDARRIELELHRQVVASRQRSFTAFEWSQAQVAAR